MFKRKPKAADPGALPLPKPIPMRKRTGVAVLDFEGAALHVAQAASGRVTRAATVAIEIPPDKQNDAKAVGPALKAALEKGKIKIKETIFAVPRGVVVLRPLQVPMVSDARELAAIVNFQIAKDLPFRIEDAVIDFKVLRAFELPGAADAGKAAPPERRLEVLVGAIKKDVLEFYRAIARDAGLKLEGLGLRSIGHAQFLRVAGAFAADSAALVLALRSDETTLDIVDSGKLVFSRVAGVPLPTDEQGNGAFVQALQIEAVRGLHSYAGGGGHPAVTKLLVCGGTGLEAAVAEALGARLNLPAEVPNARESNLAAARGLALAALEPAGLPLDFENPKKPAVPRNSKRTNLLIASAAALVLLLGMAGVRANLVKKREAVRQQVQLEVAGAEKNLPIYKRLKAQHRSVAGWLAEEKSWLDHLAYLSSILPGADQIYVSALTTTPQHVIRFSVQSKTGELLAELDKKLRAAGYDVKPLSITPANDKHGYNFRTTVELSIPAKMKPDLAKAKAPPRPADDSPPRAAASAAKGGRRS